MAHTSLLLEEDSSMSRNNDDRKDGSTHRSGDNPSAEKKSPSTTGNGSAKAGFQKQASEADAHSQDRAVVSLTNFIDLAERQVSIERAAKRLKTSTLESGKSFLDPTTKHVADIVLILAGLGLIRAGREPTNGERRLQAEAYGHLGFLVQELAPKDLVSPDLIENLIEDLGLKRPEGQEVKTFSQILESSRPPSSTQTDQVADAHNSADAAFASMSQIPFDGRGMEEGDPQKLLLPALLAARDEANQMQVDELSKGNSLEGHSHLEGQVWPSCSVTTLGQENLCAQKHEEATGSHRQFMQAIQDLLQSRYPADCRIQAAHPRTFMSSLIPCEMCKMIVRETSNVLVCDSCEKVFHLRCLQSYLLKGIPKGDWYCPKCTTNGENNQEQHQNPKYGRVKAGFSFVEGSAGALNAVMESPAQGPARTDISQRTTGSVNMAAGNASKEAMAMWAGKNHTMAQETDIPTRDPGKSSSELVSPVINGSLGGSFTALLDSFAQAENQSHPSMLKVGQSLSHTLNQIPSHSQAQIHTRSAFSHSQVGEPPTAQLQRLSQFQFQGLKGGGGAGNIAGRDVKLKKSTEAISSRSFPVVGVPNPSGQSKSTEAAESFDDTSRGSEQGDLNRLVKDNDRFRVEWIGDVVQKYDGKNFYTACSVGGLVYRLQDYALFRPETQNVPPYIARLQALWEDTNTGSKWVRVSWCYYPTDMAMIAGRPPNPEGHEVYESNHGDNNLVGTIQGQCLVLRPESFLKEMERRQELLKSGNMGEGLVPIFLCRWLYDAPSATFKPATEAP